MNNFTVTISKCANIPNRGYVAFHELSTISFESLEVAKSYGESQKKKGEAVVIRQALANDKSYSEYVSFDGEDFQEK